MPELTRRYVVMAMATEAPFDPSDPEGVFVLKPWKDPAALRALATYRDNCYPELGRDLDAWIGVIQAGPVIRGGIGRRNEAHVNAEGTRTSRAVKPGGRVARRTAKRSAAAKHRRRTSASARRRSTKRKKRSR